MKGLRRRVAYSLKQKMLSENTITCTQASLRAGGCVGLREQERGGRACRMAEERENSLSACASQEQPRHGNAGSTSAWAWPAHVACSSLQNKARSCAWQTPMGLPSGCAAAEARSLQQVMRQVRTATCRRDTLSTLGADSDGPALHEAAPRLPASLKAATCHHGLNCGLEQCLHSAEGHAEGAPCLPASARGSG